MKKACIYLAGLLLCASCIYPFTPDAAEVDRSLVFEGNLYIGEYSTMRISLVYPMGEMRTTDGEPLLPYGKASLEVEGSSEEIVGYAIPMSQGRFRFNMTEASADRRYRLHFTDESTGLHYQSRWMAVQRAPRIDEVKFVPDDQDISVQVTMTGPNADTRYFHWDYEENWEVHSDFYARYTYNFGKDPYNRRGEAYTDLVNNDIYYCWNSARSTEAGLATTVSLDSHVLPSREIKRFPRTSNRLQVLYSIDVTASGISREGYQCLKSMQDVSNTTGDLFAPIPSSVRGNIQCVEDSTMLVIGFIEVAERTTVRTFFDGTSYFIYRRPVDKLFYPDFSIIDPDEPYKGFDFFYVNGDRPVDYQMDEAGNQTMQWAPIDCVDCRSRLGRKTKPSFWPNDHK